MERESTRITRDTLLSEVLARCPEAGPIFLQRGRMFRAEKGRLYAEFSQMTIAEYAALNGIEVEPLLKRLNAALETREFEQQTSRGRQPPSDSIRRGAALGYTGAYREPRDLDIQDVVTAQTARGPD